MSNFYWSLIQEFSASGLQYHKVKSSWQSNKVRPFDADFSSSC